jgi:hypothetical protein
MTVSFRRSRCLASRVVDEIRVDGSQRSVHCLGLVVRLADCHDDVSRPTPGAPVHARLLAPEVGEPPHCGSA